MAEKKSSGFRTFLLIFITIVLAVVLSLAAYLILVPGAQIFGIKYVSNTQKVVIEEVENDVLRPKFKFSDYNTIVVNIEDGAGHTNVQVTSGTPNGQVNSQIILQQCTRGFLYDGTVSEYQISAVKNGATLTITVKEPQYNFLQVTNQTTLWLNVYENTDTVSGATIKINTGSGSVTFGGAPTVNDVPKNITFGSADIQTKSGSINLKSTTTVTSSAKLVSETGKIILEGTKTIPSVHLQSNTGKITTADIAGNVNIKSFNSHINLGTITGNVDVEMESGILNIFKVAGNLVAENTLLYTTVKVEDSVSGDVTLVNDDGHFSVDIAEIQGDAYIRTGNKPVTLSNVFGKCTVQTTNGSIKVTKAETNANLLSLVSNSGHIFANFEKVLGSNTMTTQTGGITVRFGPEATFVLNAASPNGRVYCTWLDSTENPVENLAVGSSLPASTITASSQSGGIRIENV